MRASAPTRLSKVRGAPPRLRATAKECARPALRGSRPTDRARKGRLYSRCAINSREFYFTAAAAAAAARIHTHRCARACTYVCIVHTNTRVQYMTCARMCAHAGAFDVTPPVRVRAASVAFYRARARRLERGTLVKSHRSRGAHTDAGPCGGVNFFFFSFFRFFFHSSYESRKSLVRGSRTDARTSSKISKMHNSPRSLLEMT